MDPQCQANNTWGESSSNTFGSQPKYVGQTNEAKRHYRWETRIVGTTNERKYLQHFGEPRFVGRGLKLLAQQRKKVPPTLFGAKICRNVNNNKATTIEV